MKSFPGIVCIAMMAIACSTEKKQDSMQHNLQEAKQQEAATVDTLVNKNGMKAVINSYGGILMSLWVPDKNGVLTDVVLGYDSSNQYLTDNQYFGAMIGRYGNRIAKGTFKIGEKEYKLAKNDGNNSLHGGPKGFDKVTWQLKPVSSDSLELYYLSKDGEEGYPGNLKVKITYSLSDNNELVIGYEATTDKTTVVNLTHHSYFNLAGEGNPSILDHTLFINADKFTPVAEGLIPTGELASVKGTPLDFINPTAIGKRIDANDAQIKHGKGYDHNWVLNRSGSGLELAARVEEPITGRVMEVWTTEPALQFYTGNFLDGSTIGKGGKKYLYRSAFCLEAQHYPDSPNKPQFPSTLLEPGQTYKQTTIYKFMIK